MTTVVVAGALANKPHNGGEAWVRLTWLRGLADLGLEVQLVECADVPPDGEAAQWFDDVTAWAGVSDRGGRCWARGASACAGPVRSCCGTSPTTARSWSTCPAA
jgi:hypothetical protein